MVISQSARIGRRRLIVAGLIVGALLVLWAWLMQPVGSSGVVVTPGPWGEMCQTQYYTVRNGEWLPLRLSRVTFTYGSGERFPLPERTLAPGAIVRVWSGAGADDADNIYLGRAEPGWRINGFLALLDGETRILASVMSCDPAFRIPG